MVGLSGTWTPRIEFGGATTGITYTTQTGQYQKIGSRVWIAAQIVLSSKGSATGNATIAGVPFTLQTIAVSMPVLFGSMTTSVVNMQGFFSVVGSASIALLHLTGAATSWSATTNAALSNTTSLYISGIFLTT